MLQTTHGHQEDGDNEVGIPPLHVKVALALAIGAFWVLTRLALEWLSLKLSRSETYCAARARTLHW